jgi:WD40 repeat protein
VRGPRLVRAATTPTNPYPGLRAFRESEQHLYFGRESAVDAMVDRLGRHRLLAVLGSSGSGKSSLVTCGLCPALHRGLMADAGSTWRIAVCRPGGDPIGSLAQGLDRQGVLFNASGAETDRAAAPPRASLIEATLRLSGLGLIDIVQQARLGPGVNLLVVLDQFEELFRYAGLATGDDAAAFVNLLLHASAQTAVPIFVVLSMRSDFLGDCTIYPGLAERINAGQFLVPRMTRDERRAAIAGPVGVAGGRIEPTLLTRLVNDVGDDPDQLSILQHALNRTWSRWYQDASGKGEIELRHYEAVGTMVHALDRHAEERWACLHDEPERELCARVFKSLTDQVGDLRGVRRPARLAKLCEVAGATASEVQSVIEVFRDPDCSFLVPPAPQPLDANTVIDISHESLMRGWTRLRAWLADESDSVRQLRRVADAAEQQRLGRGGLWRDPELEFALQWESRQRPAAAWAGQYGIGIDAPMRFLHAAAAARASEHARRTHRASIRRRWVGAGFLGVCAIGGLFLIQWRRTQGLLVEANAANLRKLVLQSRAMFEGDLATPIDTALQLGAAAYRLGVSDESYGGLQYALLRTQRVAHVLRLANPAMNVSSDGRLLVTTQGNTALLRDGASGGAVGTPLAGHSGTINAAAFSPDAQMLATASDDGTVRVWSTLAGTESGLTLRGHDNRVWSVAFSPDGSRIASGDEDGVVRLWDARSGTALGVLKGHRLRVFALGFSPDGRTLASGSDDQTLILWDIATLARRVLPPMSHDGAVSTLAFSPDGHWIAAGSADRSIRLWDAATGKARGEPWRGHDGRIWSVAFSPDASTLASGAEDHTVRLWEVASGHAFGSPLLGHKARVWRVAFSKDGNHLWSTSADGTFMRWFVMPPQQILQEHGSTVRSIAVSPDDRLLAAGSDDALIRLWDLSAGIEQASVLNVPPLNGHRGSVTSVAFDPTGHRLASASEDGTVRLWSVKDWQPIGTALDGKGGNVWTVAFSPNGATLASGSADGGVRLWDSGRGVLRTAPLMGHKDRVWSVAFSPSGTTLASGGDDARVRLWQLAQEQVTAGAILRGHSQRVLGLAFSPDGTRLASASEDASVELWSLAGERNQSMPLVGHDEAVHTVAFSPDGKILASGSDDATIRWWNALTGEPVGAPIRGQASAVTSVVFAAGGRTLLAASEDGMIRGWDAPAAWIDRICDKLTENLSRALWRRYVGDTPYVVQCPRLPIATD